MPGAKVKVLSMLFAAAVAGAWAYWTWGRSDGGIDPSDPAQVALGRALYDAHCASCHGADLKGEPDWQSRRPGGELPAPPHDESGHTWHHPDAQLFAIVKHGIARFAPPGYKTNMNGFGATLRDDEIRAVLAYIKSTWPADIRGRQEALNRR